MITITQPTTELLRLVSLWGYPVMLLLMIIEGPITTLVAAFLASLGYFNIILVFFLSVLGDILGDIVLYAIGHWGGRKTLIKAEKILKIKASIVTRLEEKFARNGAKIIFAVKATTGLCWITFILAGVARMKFSQFLKFSFLGGLAWSGLLVTLGFFFGFAAAEIEQYIKYAGYVFLLLAVFSIIGINLYKKKQATKLVS